MSTRGQPRTAAFKVAPREGSRRCAESRRYEALALLAAVILLGACADRGAPAEQPAETPELAYRRFVAVQVASLADSAAAAVLRDSLEGAGWVAYLRSPQPEEAGWRVRLGPSQNRAWAEVVAAGFAGRDAAVVDDSGTARPQGIAGFTRVNYESPGMLTRLRWARSADLTAILVMEDAVSVENEPAPNGFVFASETVLNSLQMDSVWDASPDPDWHRVAFGRAYVLRAGEAETPPAAMWEALADTIGVPVATLREAAFPASGMAIMFGLAQPGVARLDAQADSAVLAGSDQTPVRLYPVMAGWRVAWSADGHELLAGAAPAMVQDDSPASVWFALDPMRGEEARPVERPEIAPVEWVQGPTIDISVAPDTGRRVVVGVFGTDTLVSEHGWIRLGDAMVGPGVALTATRDARYIVALAPNPSAEEYEPKYMAVVYLLGDEPRVE